MSLLTVAGPSGNVHHERQWVVAGVAGEDYAAGTTLLLARAVRLADESRPVHAGGFRNNARHAAFVLAFGTEVTVIAMGKTAMDATWLGSCSRTGDT